MEKEKIKERIKFYQEELKKDLKMMDEEPQSFYWCNDYDFNQSLLMKYEEKLKGENKC